VKGLSKNNKKKGATLDPLAQQIQNRKAVMERVNALVARAQATQVALSKANKDNAALRAQLASDSTMIADLNSTIQRQTAAIDALSTRVDSLNGVTKQLGATIAELELQHNKAFYVIGTEDDLLKRNVIVREGGANLLIAHPGRTLQMSRTVDPSVFTPVDQRGTKTIEVPDANRRYRVVSRQSLDYATVSERDNDTFQGNLTIADIGKFWAPSRFLIIVEQ
jgi:type II secretory pathway component GspD/PulD (secretin)